MRYPNNITKTYKKPITYGNRGMDLESLLNESNRYYLERDIAVIYKKPTPIKAVDVSYAHQKKIIEKAYFEAPSTLDYNGIYRGRYIDFDAKETKNKTSFPLANVHPHQFLHLRRIIRHGGIGFLIIEMNGLFYLLKGEDILNFIDTEERKSIPYAYIQEKGFIIEEKFTPRLDYLSVVDHIYFKGE